MTRDCLISSPPLVPDWLSDYTARDYRYATYVLLAIMADHGISLASIAADLRRLPVPPRAAMQIVDDLRKPPP